MSKSALAFCCFLCLAVGSMNASTITTIFTPSNPGVPGIGDWGTYTETIGGIEIHGYRYTSAGWVDANLFGRDTTDNHGVGICAEIDSTYCQSAADKGTIDNANGLELISLKLPDNYAWQSVQLSSLDKNGSDDENEWERGYLFGNSDGDPNSFVPPLTICEFETEGAPNNLCSIGTGFEPVLDLKGGKNSKYLFFMAFDWKNFTNNDNGFLVYSATITDDAGSQVPASNVPEPASLALLGSGLAAVAGLKRRLRK